MDHYLRGKLIYIKKEKKRNQNLHCANVTNFQATDFWKIGFSYYEKGVKTSHQTIPRPF